MRRISRRNSGFWLTGRVPLWNGFLLGQPQPGPRAGDPGGGGSAAGSGQRRLQPGRARAPGGWAGRVPVFIKESEHVPARLFV